MEGQVVKNMSLPNSLKDLSSGHYTLESKRTIYRKLTEFVFEILRSGSANNGFYLTFQTRKENNDIPNYHLHLLGDISDVGSKFERNLNERSNGDKEETAFKMVFEISNERDCTTFVINYDKSTQKYKVGFDSLLKCKCGDIIPSKFYQVHLSSPIHERVKCECSQEVENWAMTEHKQSSEQHKEIVCPTCNIPMQFYLLTDHNLLVHPKRLEKPMDNEIDLPDMSTGPGRESADNLDIDVKNTVNNNNSTNNNQEQGLTEELAFKNDEKKEIIVENNNNKTADVPQTPKSSTIANQLVSTSQQKDAYGVEECCSNSACHTKSMACSNLLCDFKISYGDFNSDLINEKLANTILHVHRMFGCNYINEEDKQRREQFHVCPYCYVKSSNMEEHLENCQRAYIRCFNSINGCSAFVPRCMYNDHTRQCSYRNILCNFCKSSFCPRTNSEHLKQCIEKRQKVMCPLCDKQYPAYKIADHLCAEHNGETKELNNNNDNNNHHNKEPIEGKSRTKSFSMDSIF